MKSFSPVALAAALVTAHSVYAADVNYHLLNTIPVSGDGGWDYLTVDSAAKRLYVSHGNKIVVIDTAKDGVVGEITNTPGVHGIALAPELGRGVVTCGREDAAAIVDLKTLQIVSKVQTGGNPDAMLFEPDRWEFYTFNGRGQSATVIDAESDKVVATIPLGGKPEFCAADPKKGLVYVNIEDKSEVAVIEVKTHSVKYHWPIAPGEEATGMAFDPKNESLLIGCSNKRMVMMNNVHGKVITSAAIGESVDAVACDSGTQLVFASCGDGTTTIAREEGDKLTVVQTLKTERGARTMALDPATHEIYLATAKFEAPAEGQRRGKMVPNSFKILVYGLE
jgi:YVTN family beta-propeller protein